MSGQVQAEIGAVAASGAGAKSSRRKFGISEKLRIVEASLVQSASVAGVARAYGVNANLVFKWRKLHQQGALGGRRAIARLMRVQVAEEPAAERAVAGSVGRDASSPQPQNTQGGLLRTSAPGTIRIQLPNAQLRIEGSADVSTLRAVLEILRG